MKKIVMILAVATAACNNLNTSDKEKENGQANENDTTVVQATNMGKWKADDATKTNVAAMMRVMNDASYTDAAKAKQLHDSLQSKIDMLIKQCTMKGPEHEALHGWLEMVLKDMKELKKEDDEYAESVSTLKKSIEGFYAIFE